MLTKIKKSIPNTITSLNLLSGCVALVVTFSIAPNLFQTEYFILKQIDELFVVVAFCIFAAAFFDFCDGFAARALKAYSAIGLQLDSLADMISFGLVPAAVLHKILLQCMGNGDNLSIVLSLFPFVLTVFSALRLAKFNIDERQSESFLGLTTTACGIFVVSTAAAAVNYPFVSSVLFNPITIIVITIVLSALLVCEIPMFSLKVKAQKNAAAFAKKYLLQIVFLLISLGAIIMFGFAGVSLAIILYVLISIINWIITKTNKKQSQ